MPRTYRITAKQIARARELRAQELSWTTIGQRMRLSPTGIRAAVVGRKTTGPALR